MLVAFASGLGSRNEEFHSNQFTRAIWCLQQASRDVDVTGNYSGRTRPVGWLWLPAINFAHERRPRGRGKSTSLRVGNNFLRTIQTHPHTRDDVGGISDK